jgi:hypothetical protein
VLQELEATQAIYAAEAARLTKELQTAPRALRLTAGVQRIALGIESSFPEATLPFVEYGSPAFLTTRNDVAVSLDGELALGWLSYVAAVSAGEGFDLLGNRRKDPQLSLRLVSYPFRPIDFTLFGIPVVSGFFVNAGGSHSWHYASRLEYANSFRNDLVSTRRIEADHTRTYHLGYGFDLGPVRLTHEFARQSLLDVELPDGTSRDFERQNAGWSASLAWRITGEPYDSRPYRQREHPPSLPARPFYRDGHFGPGMIELAVRYSNFEIDRDLIDLGYTSSAIAERFTSGVSSQESRTFDFALNWVPVTPLRLGFQITRTLADQRPAVFDSHGRDTSFLFRLQVSY